MHDPSKANAQISHSEAASFPETCWGGDEIGTKGLPYVLTIIRSGGT